MKRLIIYAGILLALGLGSSGCYKNTILPETLADPDGVPQFVSYNTDLAPLFNTSCALAGCHVAGAHKPFLTTDVSFIQIVNNGYVNTVIPKQSILYNFLNGEMKEYMPKASDRQKVYDWIRNGAPNN